MSWPQVRSALAERAAERRLSRPVWTADRIVLDPGIGFAKTADHNLALMARQAELLEPGSDRLLVGWSQQRARWACITGRPVAEQSGGQRGGGFAGGTARCGHRARA
jgi:dihydropteroate synthase